MSDKNHFSNFEKATKFAEQAKFQESLNLMNDVFLLHSDGGIAYKYYFHALVEPNPETRIKDLDRAQRGFKTLLETISNNLDKKGMDEVHTRMLDHIEGLEGARRSTLEEFENKTCE